MNVFVLYLISTLAAFLPTAGYFIFKGKFKYSNPKYLIIEKWIVRGLAIVSGLCIALTIFFQEGVMITTGGEEAGTFDLNKGCVVLIGSPYGENKFLNFLAWFNQAIAFPGAVVITLLAFFPFRIGKFFNKYIQLPIAVITFVTMFNLCEALNGNVDLYFRNVFIALQCGFILSLSVVLHLQYIDDTQDITLKDFEGMIGLFVVAFISTLPVNTFATLFRTDGILFGDYQANLRIYSIPGKDLHPSFMHRFVLYCVIAFPLIIYFSYRNHDLETRKTILLTISFGCLMVFTSDFGFNQIFPKDALGNISVDVTKIPLHLCNTALYVVPICIMFDLKRLFYFTYFINVFGALMAMLTPNTGENSNIFNPGVVLFWYNHAAAFFMPLLCVALDVFKKPKFRQMLWSLGFFAIYFVIIVFANAWLSNYAESGTDYLFINSDFIASKILNDKQSESLVGRTLSWTWGDLTFVIRPLYQFIFFSVYVVIAFCMWFIYSLFFRIADSHKDLHNRLVIARKENITMRERRRNRNQNDPVTEINEVSLVFENFSKRYGNSPALSANNVNLRVEGGEIFGFLGPNGAGKSTCIKSAIGIQPVSEGHIFICGHDIVTDSVKAKKLVGYVPDHYALYEKLTGREYINYIADLYNVSKEDRDVRIAKYIDLFELNQAFDNRMQTYSHGMKQKTAIMAALIHNPKIWILDEPLTGLDPQSIYQVKKCMQEHAAEGNIVFFSSHIIDVVEKLCTRIAIVKKGNIVFEDNMTNIEKNHPEGLETFYLETIHDNGDLDN